jgi:hypothetical protein
VDREVSGAATGTELRTCAFLTDHRASGLHDTDVAGCGRACENA